ncbi:PASTA domain, binds beta-lactams [Thermoflavifilum thermophilum]|uniref:PASTA domain, binds beta-lactams n=2 Tax=Thermoflavifilum thermophilum TaxID=1393122 RepID=A0A1I7N1E6_9BACT|nr:PASTA domain, binds beta-lactams [Thermoflavifilum thermophilum]
MNCMPMNPVRWLLQKPFWVNLLAVCMLVVLLGVLFFASLRWITRHGETATVPDIMGKPYDEAVRLLEQAHFRVVVQDSGYTDTLPPLTVLRQEPEAHAVVKVYRTVYLTLNKIVPPMAVMPNLVNMSYRSAVLTLQTLKLNVGDTVYKPDIARNAVLAQLYNGQPIKPGILIPEGSRITLVLGDGIGNQANPVPNLIGLTFMQARELLSASNLSVGVVLFDGPITDTASAYVYKQIPAPLNANGQPNLIYAGQSIDLWVSQTPRDSTGQPLPQPNF